MIVLLIFGKNHFVKSKLKRDKAAEERDEQEHCELTH